jgi:hypothetical protein
MQSGVFDASIRTKATQTMERDHPGKRFSLFRDWLHQIIRVSRPDVISYERIVGGRHAGGNTTLIQKGLEALIYMEAFKNPSGNPIPLWNFAAGTIKKWGTGSGLLTNESKIVMTNNAYRYFTTQEWVETSKGPDDNQADALWINDLTRAVFVEMTKDGGPHIPLGDFEDDQLTAFANRVTAVKWSPAKRA